jgi:pimeloyl-ACP methyl ester carboxylesterase
LSRFDCGSAYDQAEIIAAFLKQRDMKNVTVVGNSFGGRVTMDVYARLSATSDRIKKLVLIDSAGPGEVVPRS